MLLQENNLLVKFNKNHIIFLCVVLGVSFAISFMGKDNKLPTNFDDAALGKATVSYFAEDSLSNKIHYMPRQDITKFIAGITPYLKNKTVLYLGNSQSHSINQKKDNDNTMSGYLFNDLITKNITFLTASIPNANLQEHYLLYSYFATQLPNLKLLIIPVFMDDLRETGIREAYFRKFDNGKFRIQENTALSQEINKLLDSFQSQSNENAISTTDTKDFDALKETTQDVVERNLNKNLKANFSFWKNREDIRGKYFLTLYKLRNTILNISSQTTRKMIMDRYTKNLNALNLMIKHAKKNNTKILLLIPPLRKDIKYPYDKEEYRKFKLKLKKIAQQPAVTLVDIDNIIEGKYWGFSAPTQLFKTKDYDFMHFQAAAHKILADTLKPYILKELL